jgi:hypothetical protein
MLFAPRPFAREFDAFVKAYSFNEEYKQYILETGEKVKLPFGLVEFSIIKKKRRWTLIWL